MRKKKKQNEEPWVDEMKNFPTTVPNTNYEEETEEEKRELKEAQEFNEYRKNLEKPRRKFKWNMRGKIFVSLLLILLEFLLLSTVFYFLVPLAVNIKLTVINTISISTLFMFLKKWAKD